MNTIKMFALLISLFFPFYAFSNEQCQKTNRDKFLSQYESIYEEYKKVDPKIIDQDIKRAFWIDGDPKVGKALFVAHGYMGSPGEMMYLAEPFIKNGWSVIGFLIPGHGSSYKVANQFKSESWISQIKNDLLLVSECYSEVRAIGFSTGGLLLNHFVMNEKVPTSLKSLHLISPYFIQRFGGFFDRFLGFFVNGLSVDTAYFISRFRDLKVMTIDRQFYNQDLPIDAGLQIKELGLNDFNAKVNEQQTLPVQLFLTEGDWTVNTDKTKEVIYKNFKNVDLRWYPGSEPHHLMVPSVSGVASEIQQLIFSFKQ